MRNCFAPIVGILLLASCGAPSTEPENAAPAKPPAPAAAQMPDCAQLNGLTYEVTLYLDNQKSGTDQIHFVGEAAYWGASKAEGYHDELVKCWPDKPGTIQLQWNGTKRASSGADDFFRWKATILPGEIDGVLWKGKLEGEYTTWTFAGKPVQ